MSLAKKRAAFSYAFAQLFFHAICQSKEYGYIPVIGETYRHPSATIGHPMSTHRVGLAGHILVYTPDHGWPHPDDTNIYNMLHDFWDKIGGSKRIAYDLNHFSFEHNGVR